MQQDKALPASSGRESKAKRFTEDQEPVHNTRRARKQLRREVKPPEPSSDSLVRNLQLVPIHMQPCWRWQG